jgi:multiple sugar transport system ATP-binding protein
MTMGHRVAVLSDGILMQVDRPRNLYSRPTNRFVAGFIGSPAMNFVDGIIAPAGRAVILDLPGSPSLPLAREWQPGRLVDAGLRPEHLTVESNGTPCIGTTASALETTGSVTYLYCGSAPEIVVVLSERDRISRNESVRLSIAPDKIHLFDRETGLALR